MTTQEPAAPKDSSAERTRAYRAKLKAAGQRRADLPPCLPVPVRRQRLPLHPH
jgi:hypothetical protein